MRVIPVIDLRGGRAVHARGGARDRYAPVVSRLAPRAEPGDAVALARAYRDVLGAEEMYVADLDAITSGATQHEPIAALAQKMALWVDAGVRAAEGARELVDAGVARVVVGLETLGDLDALAAVIDAVGSDRAAFSLDLRGGVPLASSDALRAFEPPAIAHRAWMAGARVLIVLDVVRVGSGGGPELALIRALRDALPDAVLIAGGGVRDADDLRALESAGASGALVATALHDGRLGRAELDAARQRGR